LIPLGPLFSIVLNFTFIFMVFRSKATESMLEYLSTEYEVPDILTSPDYIRNRVIALVERDLVLNPIVPESSIPEPISDVVVDEPEEPESVEAEPESITEDDS
ncbi:MAG: hypothetical protein RTV72_12300, partial [Candidatus Thorarchaeota archaeon]